MHLCCVLLCIFKCLQESRLTSIVYTHGVSLWCEFLHTSESIGDNQRLSHTPYIYMASVCIPDIHTVCVQYELIGIIRDE
jgi:hypothetical protein